MEEKVLDSSLIKDLSNHIYEKRKATAFQIESFTKSALAKNDSQTIYKIINELTELTNNGTNSAKMGAITALGSVSVALGSFAIAYFLEEIIKPIIATFRDTDARVRYYACESLYNIAKIARGEILLYFNEVFDILCILVTDSESSVKNAADILDRLIKDIVSAKSTSYVSILHQKDEQSQLQSGVQGSNHDDTNNGIPSHVIDPTTGVAIQVNNVQDVQKAFSLPKFIPTLLERMYTIDPFAKKFLISWLELFDDIPALELITFIPNFLEPLIKFLTNNSPSDVRIETQNLLNIFLKEIKGIHKVKLQVKRQQLLHEEELKKEMAVLDIDEVLDDEKGKLGSGDGTTGTSAGISTGTNTGEVSGVSEGTGSGGNPSESIANSGASKSNIEGNETKNLKSDVDQFNLDEDQESIKSESTTIMRKSDDALETTISPEDFPLNGDDGELFLNGQDIFIDYPKIIDILLSFLRSPDEAGKKYNDTKNETHEVYLEIQFTILKWLQEILIISPTSFIKCFPDCVSITLKNIEATDGKFYELRNQFLKFNLSLQGLLIDLNESGSVDDKDHIKENGSEEISEEPPRIPERSVEQVSENLLRGINREVYDEFTEFQLNKTLQAILTECFTSVNELSRITGLDWLIFLYSTNPTSFFDEIEGKNNGGVKIDLTALLRSSTDSSNNVILKVLQLLSKISETNQPFFKGFMIELITFFEKEMPDNSEDGVSLSRQHNGALTRHKIEFIIRKLCVTLNSEKIFKTLSEVLVTLENLNLDFMDLMTVTLNNILLTTQELSSFRKKLKNLDIYKLEDWSLFATLFQSWCHNAPSALSLCLLTSNYELAFLIIKNLCEQEISFQLLTQLDILVQLLESPIFVKLRLQLLEPEKNPYLYKTLYGLLMILPQSSTFTSLKNRLSSVSHVTGLSAPTAATISVSGPGTPTSGATPAGTNSQLSIKRKRVLDMLEKFTKVQEKHEIHQKIPRHTSHNVSTSASVSEPGLDDEASRGYRETKKERLLPYQSVETKKEYLGDSKPSDTTRRKTSGRFGLTRFNG